MSMPFISYGGTSYVVSMALVGLMLSVWRRNNLASKTPTPIISSNTGKKFIEFQDGKLIINYK